MNTITAPGSKVWDFDYNDIGQRVQVTHANGIVTVYDYDNRNRMTKIEHKNGATVVDGFTYALDSQGEITRVTYQDGAYWDYAYDGRYRLTSAVRKNSGGTTLQAHAYVYNAGDNLVSKTVAGTTTVFGRRTREEVKPRGRGGARRGFRVDARELFARFASWREVFPEEDGLSQSRKGAEATSMQWKGSSAARRLRVVDLCSLCVFVVKEVLCYHKGTKHTYGKRIDGMLCL